MAEDLIRELDQSGRYDSRIVTEVSQAPEFFPAEEYHQDYFAQNPGRGYCQGRASVSWL